MYTIFLLFSTDAIDSSTQMVLVNAIYFKGLWEVPFRLEATRSSEFHLSNGGTKVAQFMRLRHVIKTGVDLATKAKVVILPFEVSSKLQLNYSFKQS